MKTLFRISTFFVYTNILIGLAAAAQVMLTYEIFGIDYNIPVISLEFVATLLLYNLSIWMSKPENYKSSPYERTRWIFGNVWLFWFLSSLALLMLFYLLLQIKWMTLLYLAAIGLLSFAYALPVVKIKGRWKSFRHIAYTKLFHIALIWSLSTVGLVYIESFDKLQSTDWWILCYFLICKFLFILLITLPFDIRDMKQDSYYHLKTVPLALGQSKAQNLCYILAVLHILLVILMPTSVSIKVGLILCDILVLILFKTKIFKEQNSFLNVYLLDLMLIVQYVICLLSIYVVNYFVR